jgi:TolB protein
MAYGEDRSPPKVYLQNVDSGRRELMGNFWHELRAALLAGRHQGGDEPRPGRPDQSYEMDVRGAACDASPTRRRSTPRPAIPRRHADRVQLRPRRHATALRHELAGGGDRRISQYGHAVVAGVVAARATTFAFTKITGGSFGIGVMRPDGSGERLLANGFSWRVRPAPNGRVLPFLPADPIRGRAGGVTLRCIDITGSPNGDPDCHRRIGSRLVSLDSAMTKDMIFAVDPSVAALGSRCLGAGKRVETERSAA